MRFDHKYVAIMVTILLAGWLGWTSVALSRGGPPHDGSANRQNEANIGETTLFSDLDGGPLDEDGMQDGVFTVEKLVLKKRSTIVVDVPSARFRVWREVRIEDEAVITGPLDLPAVGPRIVIEAAKTIEFKKNSVLRADGAERGGRIVVCGEQIAMHREAVISADGVSAGSSGGSVRLVSVRSIKLEDESARVSANGGNGGTVILLACGNEGNAIRVKGAVEAIGRMESGGMISLDARQGGIKISGRDARVLATGVGGAIDFRAGRDVDIDRHADIRPEPGVTEWAPSDDDCFCEDLVLGAIGDKTVNVGSTLRFQLIATGQSDALLFSARPLPLPSNATLDAVEGAFAFRPTLDQVGAFDITFVVSDGTFEDSETITITVLGPDPGAPTGLSGRLLDTNDHVLGFETPIEGATVSLIGTGHTTVSGADGRFVLEDTPAGVQILDIDATTAQPAPDGSPYASFREGIELIENVQNVVDRPFFLPRIDRSSLTTVDPLQTTVVENPGLGITMTIPPNTAKNPDGSNFTGDLSISLVPQSLAPASLPDFLEPGLLVTIQPLGVTYATPVPITFANIDELDPGTEANLWSLDPDQGTFEVFGTLRATVDGASLETISGGVRANDWHGPIPQQPDDDDGEQPDDDDSNDDECTDEGGSLTGLHSGRLIIDHTLVGYRSAGRARSIRLVYNSTSADPQPLIKSSVSIAPNNALPDTLSTEVTLGGVVQSVPIHTSTTGPNGDLEGQARIAAQFDACTIPTGLQPYFIKLSSNYPQTTVSRFRAGTVLINNERSSPFGVGWTIDGLQRLHLQNNGTRAILTEGTGAIKAFTPQQSLGGVGTDLAFVIDGSGSVSGSDFQLQLQGLATAVGNPLVVPPDGSVAITVVQFASSATVHIPLTVIDSEQTAQSVATAILAIRQLRGGTAIHAGIDTAVEAIGNGSPDARQVICLSTDGDSDAQLALIAAQNAVAAGIDEIDTIGIGNGVNKVLLQQIAEIGNGFFVTVASFEEFADTIDDKLQAVIGGSPPGDFSFVVRNDDATYTRTMKDGIEHLFDAQGFHTATVDRNGRTTTYTYNAAGCVESMTDPVGGTTLFTYDANDKLETVTDPAGRTTLFEHDANDCLTSITDPDGSRRSFAYDPRFRMMSQTSKRGHVTTYDYAFSGRHSGSVLPDGSTRGIVARDAIGVVDTDGGFGTRDNPALFALALEARGEIVDGDGFANRVVTNRFGAVIGFEDPLGRVTTIERDSDNLTGVIVRPNERMDVMEYDDRGNLTARREAVGSPLERETRYEYNAFSQITKIIDAGQNVTSIEFDAEGNQIKTTDPRGNIRTRTYVPGTGLLATSTDENGHTTAFAYDANDMLETVTNPEGVITKYTRDLRGNVLGVTDGFGTAAERTRSFTYDDHDRVLTATDGNGGVTTFTYNERGHLVSTMNPTGQVITRTYDELGRVIRIEDPLLGVTTMTHDRRGNLKTRTDALGAVTTLEYDEDGQLIRTTDALGGQEDYSYDEIGNVVAFTDANRQTTTFEYDLLNRRTGRCNPLNQCTQASFDSRDNLVMQITANGDQIVHRYDEQTRLVETVTADNLITFIYDPAGNLCSAVDADTALELTYDDTDRLETATTSPDPLGACDAPAHRPESSSPLSGGLVQPMVTLTYEYDAVGNRIRMEDSEGGITLYEYDDEGRLRFLTMPSGEVIEQTFDAAGRLETISYPNAIVADYQYDSLTGRLSMLRCERPAGVLLDMAYQYDAVGNVTQIVEPGEVRVFSYDALHRLRTAGTAQAPEFYEYDAAGNRTASHISQTYTYDAANRLLSNDQHSYAYDANGALVSRVDLGSTVETVFERDVQGQLVAVLDDGLVIAEYQYDGLGRRVAAGPDRVSVFDEDHVVLSWLDGLPDPVRSVYGNGTDEHLAELESSGAVYVLRDHLFSSRVFVREPGGDAEFVSYDAFGQPSQVPAERPAPAFAGRGLDPATGLFFMRARYYDGSTGRFLSEDPKAESAGDRNLYRYVRSNPTRWRDPFGLEACDASSLPSFGDLANHPLPSQFGECQKYKDEGLSCAVKLSDKFTANGGELDGIPGTTCKLPSGEPAAIGAEQLYNNLRNQYCQPGRKSREKITSLQEIAGRSGIILFDGMGYGGDHVDLWDGQAILDSGNARPNQAETYFNDSSQVFFFPVK